MGVQGHDAFATPSRVVLAHERPFRIGELQVEPATRQVRSRDTRESLEPRVMQVLLALARANGEVVARDDLIDWCWDGRIVSDDAVNRVLSRIRRLANGLGRGSFTVETIAKVGYRLVPAGRDESIGAAAPAVPEHAAFGRRAVLGGAFAVASIGVTGAAIVWTAPEPRAGPSAEAKALYERALTIRQEERGSSNRHALAYLREAVRLAPEYGEAWGTLALTYRSLIVSEAAERVPGFAERRQEAVRNAERFDPGNADAAAAMLPSDGPFGQWSGRERLFRGAIDRHSDHPLAYSLLATVLMDVGRWSDAADLLGTATRLAPASPLLRYKLAVSLWSAGRISAADDELEKAMQLWPQHGAIWQTRIKILALTGRAKEAFALASDPAATPLDSEDAPYHDGQLLFLRALATKSAEDVEQSLRDMLREAKEIELNRVAAALKAAVLGRANLALDVLEGVYLGTGRWAVNAVPKTSMSTHPLFQPHASMLWHEPRFARILAAIGLEAYWRRSGTQPEFRR